MQEKIRTNNIDRLGLYSSLLTGICTVLFAIFMVIGFVIPANMLSYFVCLLLSVFFVVMINVLYAVADSEKKIYGRIAISFAIVYAVYICLVYYTQITVVRLGGMSKEILSVISYSPSGTLFFAIDMLGYTFLTLSTFSAAFIFSKKGLEGLIKKLLIIHGTFAIPTFIFPMLPIFGASDATKNITFGGVIALLAWCALFAPICFLITKYFSDRIRKGV